MNLKLRAYYRNYRKQNYGKIRESERKSYEKRIHNPQIREQSKIYRRAYMRAYRRKLGIPERKFTGENIDKNLKGWLKKLSIKYGNYCVRCGTAERLSVNHKIPRCIGGITEEKNLEIMCLSCNVKTFHEVKMAALKEYFKNQTG